MSFRLQMAVLSAGERLPVLKEATGTPHWFATLFATTQLRNPGKAPNTTLSVLAAVRSLLIWAETKKICIEPEARLSQRDYFKTQTQLAYTRLQILRRWAPSRPFQEVLQPFVASWTAPCASGWSESSPSRFRSDEPLTLLQGTHHDPIENALRPVALESRNWLFTGSETADKRAAVIMSLLAPPRPSATSRMRG
jgi:hypothetical protein